MADGGMKNGEFVVQGPICLLQLTVVVAVCFFVGVGVSVVEGRFCGERMC